MFTTAVVRGLIAARALIETEMPDSSALRGVNPIRHISR